MNEQKRPKRHNIYIETDVWNELKEHCESKDISISKWIERAVKERLGGDKQVEQKNRQEIEQEILKILNFVKEGLNNACVFCKNPLLEDKQDLVNLIQVGDKVFYSHKNCFNSDRKQIVRIMKQDILDKVCK